MSTPKGADKAARRAEERAQAEKEKEVMPLDPEFPFRAIAFSPGFFGAAQEHPPKEPLPERDV